jgi:CubicO group peptidase (beta-lactamase class C family)
MKNKLESVNRLAVVFALLLLCVTNATSQSVAPSAGQFAERVDEYMKAAVGVDGFSGTILVARDGVPVVSKGYGMASVELDVSNTPQTVFRLGSVTKQFTGMAITMLQERGKLSVSDSLCKFLTECPEAWKPITVKNLLTHTSGITNYTSFPDFAKTATLPITTDDMIGLVKDKPLDFVPGAKFAYSNSGYLLLGIIIERTSGKSYAKFLQENIFIPLGMKQSGYDDPIKIIRNRAAGYQRQDGKYINAAYMDMTIPYAAGALYSTTGDLLLWDQALYTEKLVSQKSLDEMFTPFKDKTGYAFGWGIGKKFDRKTISHGGGIYGFATQITRFPDDRVTVIVLSNVQGAPAGRVSNDLAAITFGEKYEIPQELKAISVDTKILGKYVGAYKIEQPSLVITIMLESGKLFGQVNGQSKFGLLPESDTKFFSKDTTATFTFVKDSNGLVTGLTLHQGGGAYPAKKIK